MHEGMKVQMNLDYPYGLSYASSALAGSSSSEDGGGIQMFPGGLIPEMPEIGEEFIFTIPYRFCGKEQHPDDGLGMYDFLARHYSKRGHRYFRNMDFQGFPLRGICSGEGGILCHFQL